MFEYCNECVQEVNSSSSSVWVQATAAGIALLALIVAVYNLWSLRNAQSLTAKVNLINVEVEMRKSYVEYKNLLYEVNSTEDIKDSFLKNKKRFAALERYISTADKLASLIVFVRAVPQYNKGTDWKAEYSHIFDEVLTTVDTAPASESTRITPLSQNVRKVYNEWKSTKNSYQSSPPLYSL